jgi:hypothetical protein
MKKRSLALVCNLVMLWLYVSCSQSINGNETINISESGHYYKMLAHFNPAKTTDVDEFMDHKIGKRSNMSFLNSRIDGKIALDDHTTFYIKKSPGYLQIKLDKEENSIEAYERIKSMCEGIKKMISK